MYWSTLTSVSIANDPEQTRILLSFEQVQIFILHSSDFVAPTPRSDVVSATCPAMAVWETAICSGKPAAFVVITSVFYGPKLGLAHKVVERETGHYD